MNVPPRLSARLTNQCYPALAAFTLCTVMATSKVDLSIWAVSGRVAVAFTAAYALLLSAMAVSPTRMAAWHGVGAAFAVLVFGGRGAGFAAIILDSLGTHDERWDLLGAVTERVLLLASMIVWHRSQAIVGARAIVRLERAAPS